MNSCIIYEGPSVIDGQPIVVIATGLEDASANSKTGAMVQTWILRADCPPQEAAKDGRDESICGHCVHRADKTGKRTCYVTLFHAPRAVFTAYARGSYTYQDPEFVGTGRFVRIGSYGDPAAVPANVWRRLLTKASGWTGYTHQHNHPSARVRRNAAKLKQWCMASVESVKQAEQAHAEKWRTFRVLPTTGGAHLPVERVCPASAEAGKSTTCEACRACSGATGRGHSSIIIRAHGVGAKALTDKLNAA